MSSSSPRSSGRLRTAAPFEREAIGRLRAFVAARAERFRGSPGFGRFYDQLEPGEGERVGALWSCVEALQMGDERSAAAPAEALVRSMPDEDDAAGAMAVRTFAEALLARVRRHSHGGGNLYTTARPPGAQLRAFELFRQRLPLVSFGWEAATALLCDALARRTSREGPGEVTLVDVGIGRGTELRQLVRQLAVRKLARAVNVVGVDPDSSSASFGALEIAQDAVLEAAAEAGLPARFQAVPKVAEELTVADFHSAAPRGAFVAVCALSLHHVAVHGGHALSGRDAVLRTLRAAGVESLVLVEPDSDHYVDALDARFLYAYRHYRTLARALRARLSPGDAVIVWSEFLAPEVRNVIGHDGVLRVERHEELSRWNQRLVDAGFVVDDVEGPSSGLVAPPGFELVVNRDGCRVGFGGVPLLGVTRARSY